jgi:hypothetical protein
MNLIPESLINRIPKLYDTEHEADPMVCVKLFFPDFHWTWYIIEYDGDDLCFGWVHGDFPELGYFRLSELKQVRGAFGCCIQRDLYFQPCRLSEVQRRYA